ncbi:hypothetical protein TanjilG_00040 [Lupinus angustifolius]|uniref:CRM domain-containing protein n=1 Tax=Lupinus angustifolius TaxID=3871 RepID=A0A394CZ61_LUPAN|nr:PREDICTED: CRS2-associated factor 1, chloroplastic [Lupinus angustifolius]OIW16083.1 hypothetical protein TanjilG_00040 [Lupinus angustifolius]
MQLTSSPMLLKLPIRFPIFSPPFDSNQNPPSSTVLRFSRWNTNTDNHRRSSSSDELDTPSSPSQRSIRYSKWKNKKQPEETPTSKSHPAFRFSNIPKSKPIPLKEAPDNIKMSDDGVSYVIDGAPFEFKYSYTETPKARPVKMREAPFVPFGPATMPRPWTGRAPLPPSKKKLREFDSFVLPPPDKKGIKPVQSPGPFLPGTNPRYVKTREEILGEPLTKHEVGDMIRSCLKSSRQLNIGRDGLTHNMLDNIHAHWKRRRVCKIKCKGVCTVDMENVCQQLEEKTGGKVIFRMMGVLYLFRGRNYNYRSRPYFPLMLWKPIPPVYPKLIQRVPEGLTLDEATKMRQKGRDLIPICKIGKNGVYCNLVNNVREAFEECELVRINCQGLNKSDYRKIGAKLRDLVPCTLLSFENEYILMWRGQNWKSSLPDVGDVSKGDSEVDVNNENYKTLPSDTQELSAPLNSLVEAASNLSHDTTISTSSSDMTLDEVEVPFLTENSKQPVSMITDSASLTTTFEAETTHNVTDFSEAETTNNVTGSYGEPEACGSTIASMTISDYDSCAEYPSEAMSGSHGTEDRMDNKSSSDSLFVSVSRSVEIQDAVDNYINGMEDPHADKLLDDSGVGDVSPLAASPWTDEILLLLEQAVEKGSALVLDEVPLDADKIYQTTVSFSKSASPGPVFRTHKKVGAKKSKKQEVSTLETKETNTVAIEVIPIKANAIKVKREKSSKIPKRGNFDQFLNVVPQGTLGVDELANLLS